MSRTAEFGGARAGKASPRAVAGRGGPFEAPAIVNSASPTINAAAASSTARHMCPIMAPQSRHPGSPAMGTDADATEAPRAGAIAVVAGAMAAVAVTAAGIADECMAS